MRNAHDLVTQKDVLLNGRQYTVELWRLLRNFELVVWDVNGDHAQCVGQTRYEAQPQAEAAFANLGTAPYGA